MLEAMISMIKTMTLKHLLFGLCIVVMMNCDSNSDYSHPNKKKLESLGEVDYSIELESSEKTPIEGLTIESSNLVREISLAESLPEDFQVFDIAHLKMDGNGLLYLAPQNIKSIIVLSETGEFKYLIGREGKGPGEFLEIRAMDFNSDYSKLFVLDRNEIEVFEFDNLKNQYVPQNTIIHKLNMVNDLCLMNERVFIQGFSFSNAASSSTKSGVFKSIEISKPVHEINLESGAIVNSFGLIYPSFSGAPPLDGILNKSSLSCNSESETIVSILENFAYFFGFDSDGEHLWTSNISDFLFQNLEERDINTPNAGLSYGSSNEPINSIYSVISLNDSTSILQVGTVKIGGSFEYDEESTDQDLNSAYTILIDQRTGSLEVSTFYDERLLDANEEYVVSMLEMLDSNQTNIKTRIKIYRK